MSLNLRTLRAPLLTSLLACGLSLYGASAPGIGNFDKVDEHVYRGAQPTNEGVRYLAAIGVKVVLDLREAGARGEAEAQIVKTAGMRYVNVPMTGLTPPSDAEISTILHLLEDPNAGPVFVHCKRGADRTGAVIAAYHLDFQGWDNARALKDARAHGMGFYQLPRQNFVKNFRPLVAGATMQSQRVASN
jgi:protein-tyrosine phosphatase